MYKLHLEPEGNELILTKELLQNLSIIQILCQVLNDDPLPDQHVIDPVDKHLRETSSRLSNDAR